MIDIHSHILPGVDDGALNLEQALEIAREAKEQGVQKIVATPHYTGVKYKLSPEQIETKLKQLRLELKQAGIELELLSGSELYLTADLAKKAEQGLLNPINGGSYLLVELPMDRVPSYAEDVFYDLQVLGYRPIIAHPERNAGIIKNPNYLYRWIKDGILAQLNAGSLLGYFGSRVENTARILVKHNLVQLIGSDVHSTARRKYCLQAGVKRLEELVDSKLIRYFENAEDVVNDRELKAIQPKYYREKKGFFDRVKLTLGWS